MSVRTSLCALVLLMLALPVGADIQIPPEEELRQIINTPKMVEFEVQTDDLAEGVVVANQGIVHILADVSLRSFRNTLLDMRYYPEFVPRIAESRVSFVGGNPPTYDQDLRLSFKVFYFGEEYFYRLRVTMPRDEAERVLFQYELAESYDGYMEDVQGRWDLIPVQLDGKEYLYARFESRFAIRENTFGLKSALKLFGQNDLLNTVDAFYTEAKLRDKQRED